MRTVPRPSRTGSATLRNVVAFAGLLLIGLGLASCSGSNGTASRAIDGLLAVTPTPVTVTMGGSVTFSALFQGPVPEDPGTFHWTINPASGGTITDHGVYTAANTAGDFTVNVTWTSSRNQLIRYTGGAAVTVLPTPQSEAVVTPEIVQASGGSQGGGAIQNAPIVGESVAATQSSDSTGRTQIRHGFKAPNPCTQSNGTANQQSCTTD